MSTQTKDKLKVAVAGCGFGANHLRGYADSELCEIVAIWSRTEIENDRNNSEQAAHTYNVPLYTDFKKMLKELQPDIVSVAVREEGHEEMTITALEHGAHVYCEKLLAPSVPAAQRMVDKAAEMQRSLNVGYNYRYSTSCQYIADKIKSGAIGEPLFVHLRAFACCIHHMTDYVCSLLGTPEKVVSVINCKPLPDRPLPHDELNYDSFFYTGQTMKTYMVEFAGGAVLMAGATDYSNIMNPAADLLIEGTEGRIILDDINGTVKVWQGLSDPWSGADAHESREAIHYHPSQIRDEIGLIPNCHRAVQDFARSVYEGESAPMPGESGVNMIKLEEAIFKSSQTRQWESV